MNPEVKAQWVEALRSGRYEQGFSVLASQRLMHTRYCCLGVLCDLAVKAGRIPASYPEDRGELDGTILFDEEEYEMLLPPSVVAWAGFSNEAVKESPAAGWDVKASYGESTSLSEMNDAEESFLDIASYIEENL